MSELIKVGISGVGSYVPERVLSNHDLEKLVDTSDEWIVQRTGIKERRIARPDEASGDMGTMAAKRALADANVDPADLDLVICATTTPDNPFPATACHIASDIGAVRAGGFDVNAACSGFIFALIAGSQFVACGTYRKVLVIGTEKLSSILDWTDRNTCILFGDGAGAVVLEPLEKAGKGEFLSTSIHMEGGHDESLRVIAGGSRMPASHDTIENRLHFIKMGGNKIFKFAVKTFAELVETAVGPYGYEQLGVIVPHQVNQRIIESAIDRLAIPRELIFANIHKYGNTAAASVPLALDEAVKEGRCRKGFLVCMVAFGGGLTWGHALLRW